MMCQDDCFAGARSNLQYLLSKANKRRYMYIRPGSRKNLLNYFKTFLLFACHYDITIFDLNPHFICAYIEFLLHSFKCPGTVRNYVSGLSTFCAWLDLDQTIFTAFPVRQMWRAVDLTVRYKPIKATPLGLKELACLLESSNILGKQQLTFRALVSLLFFTMSRLSTFLPKKISPFDHTRNLTLGDVFYSPAGMNIRIKWAKNVQLLTNSYFVPLFASSSSQICPVLNLMCYL